MVTFAEAICPQCKLPFVKQKDMIDASIRHKRKLFCSKDCSHEHKRKTEVTTETDGDDQAEHNDTPRKVTLPKLKFLSLPPDDLYKGDDWREKVRAFYSEAQQR